MASETSKIIENSYRAVNIAFIHEWTEFAEKSKINLFEIIEAIKKEKHIQTLLVSWFRCRWLLSNKKSVVQYIFIKKNFETYWNKFPL